MRVALVPGVLALLPEYAGLTDPVADLRAACLGAVSWLGGDVTVLADAQGCRVAESLLAAALGSSDDRAATAGASYLVVANGSACRSEKAPGHLDDRAAGFDRDLETFLRGAGPLPPAPLARELLASTTALADLPAGLDLSEPAIDYADDPFGVQYWVMRWPCAS